MVPAPPSDELIERAARGDQSALALLIEQHDPILRERFRDQIPKRWQSVLSLDDLLQETYTDAFLDIAGFVPQGENSFVRWLSVIAKYNLINAIQALEADKRGGGRVPLSPAQQDDSFFALHEVLGLTTTTPSRQAGRIEAKAAIEAAIAKLPREYRAVIRMYDIEGHPVQDVATSLNRSAGAVYMLRARAHRALGKLMGAPREYFSDFA